MILLGAIFEDFVNYKVPCMTLEFPYCSMKCDIECRKPVCQNGELAASLMFDVNIESIIQRYLDNPITHAICMQGMEPFDSWSELDEFIALFRKRTDDDIVIYTGYTKCEIQDKIDILRTMYSNIVVKFGRFVPNQKSHYDDVLGVYLASDNQYAERIC